MVYVNSDERHKYRDDELLERNGKFKPVNLGLIIGMMCAFDMGGPINKAAYLTGTALLAQGNYFFMAGVSAAALHHRWQPVLPYYSTAMPTPTMNGVQDM